MTLNKGVVKIGLGGGTSGKQQAEIGRRDHGRREVVKRWRDRTGGQGRAGQGRAGQGRAGQGKTEQSRAADAQVQNRTELRTVNSHSYGIGDERLHYGDDFESLSPHFNIK
eukprot:749286-Hanusia_phi.AAC.3